MPIRRASRRVRILNAASLWQVTVRRFVSQVVGLVNLWLDGAGRHRRLAGALPVVSICLMVIAATKLVESSGTVDHVGPAVFGASLGWFGLSLRRTGQVVDGGGLPHPSFVASVVAAGWWGFTGSGSITAECCEPATAGTGLCLFAGAVVLFVGAERGGSQTAMPGGRLLLSVASALLAMVSITGAAGHVTVGGGYPMVYGTSLGVIGLALLSLAVCEGRLALRMLRRAI